MLSLGVTSTLGLWFLLSLLKRAAPRWALLPTLPPAALSPEEMGLSPCPPGCQQGQPSGVGSISCGPRTRTGTVGVSTSMAEDGSPLPGSEPGTSL